MSQESLMSAMNRGMDLMGATFVKKDNTHAYFDVKIGSAIDNETKLSRAKAAYKQALNLGLKIRKV